MYRIPISWIYVKKFIITSGIELIFDKNVNTNTYSFLISLETCLFTKKIGEKYKQKDGDYSISDASV